MKQFEIWDDSLPVLEKRYQSLERKKAWRAALEWALKQELIDDDGRFINSYVIREELEKSNDQN